MNTHPGHSPIPPQARHAAQDAPRTHCELRFQPLCDRERALAFPCDAAGQVRFDEMSEAAKDDYLYARVVLGREFAWPQVVVLG